MLDPNPYRAAAAGLPGGPTGERRGSDVGACFQLALLAAGQGNDKEAGDYLRQIVTAMKAMVKPGGSDAGASPNT
ncbi:hypothetical protein LCGC14_1599760 [marine sediment metagenome]|uniref:Uncharacterized protein n=1 Tax=marine sediment metagenome TaxID=412755 RepID=A0A0F9IBG8_9ZZZZ